MGIITNTVNLVPNHQHLYFNLKPQKGILNPFSTHRIQNNNLKVYQKLIPFMLCQPLTTLNPVTKSTHSNILQKMVLTLAF